MDTFFLLNVINFELSKNLLFIPGTTSPSFLMASLRSAMSLAMSSSPSPFPKRFRHFFFFTFLAFWHNLCFIWTNLPEERLGERLVLGAQTGVALLQDLHPGGERVFARIHDLMLFSLLFKDLNWLTTNIRTFQRVEILYCLVKVFWHCD